jgi:ABC-type dipeptide/oligopeptide/nickel transport system ATPase component
VSAKTKKGVVRFESDAGKVVEIGPAEDVLFSPRHPYTQDLLRCVPLPSHGVDPKEVCTLREPTALALTDAHRVSCVKYGG